MFRLPFPGRLLLVMAVRGDGVVTESGATGAIVIGHPRCGTFGELS